MNEVLQRCPGNCKAQMISPTNNESYCNVICFCFLYHSGLLVSRASGQGNWFPLGILYCTLVEQETRTLIIVVLVQGSLLIIMVGKAQNRGFSFNVFFGQS